VRLLKTKSVRKVCEILSLLEQIEACLSVHDVLTPRHQYSAIDPYIYLFLPATMTFQVHAALAKF
jgi:hypothetical protein